MALNGAEISYISGQKNNWRRWAWNRLKDRLPDGVKPRDAKIVYLAGRDDLDREEAERRGFNPANMVSIETDRNVVRDLRRKGVTVIHGDLVEVLTAWPDERKIHVIMADFCGGLSEKTVALMSALMRPHSDGAAVCVNLQRGRDEGARYREAFNQRMVAQGLAPLKEFKHRGKMFLEEYIDVTNNALRTYWPHIVERYRRDLNAPSNRAAIRKLTYAFAEFNSYRQAHSAVYMDSVVFKSMIGCTYMCPEFGRKNSGLRRRVAAALAIQTMRRTGHLKSA